MTRRRTLAAFALIPALALGLAHLTSQPAAAQDSERGDLSGTWQLAGWNMGTDRQGDPSYTGTVVLDNRGQNTYRVAWHVGENVNEGIGLYDPRTDTFAAGYSIGGSPGVAIYRFSEDGETMDCVGTFERMLGQVAWEEWKQGDE